MGVLGIELGSTRIKAVLINEANETLAAGAYDWENKLDGGIWTYDLADVWTGLHAAVAQVRETASKGEIVEAVGISAMMHGYLAFDRDGKQLAQFRTWRNTITETAAAELSSAFSFNVPQRWSAAHLYQAILNGEDHVQDIASITTLAGYVHRRLTGEACLGVGDASGMFPITDGCYDAAMLAKFDEMARTKGFRARLESLLPRVLIAGDDAGRLNAEGALLLDPTGWIKPGTPLCPPEGDAGTGMTATNSITPLTGNVSAGTSIFAMIVLEKPLEHVYPEIDIVTTPSGSPVAMVHCNNCTSDLDAWVGLFGEAFSSAGLSLGKSQLYEMLYNTALEAEPNAGGLLHYNYYGGEQITNVSAGAPLFVRRPDSRLSLCNLFRSLLFSSVATLKLGMAILEYENVKISNIRGHGGLFKTKGVAQRIMASALGVPIDVAETAGEGGAWGVAILAGYMIWRGRNQTLESYLQSRVFADDESIRAEPDANMAAGFADYMKLYAAGLPLERAAAGALEFEGRK